MTKLESLRKALLLWQWMGEHPGALKADAYLELGLPIGDLNDCPVCEYDVQAGGKDSDCSHCLLWPTVRAEWCFSAGSEYRAWFNNEGAGPMLALIRQRLKECEA